MSAAAALAVGFGEELLAVGLGEEVLAVGFGEGVLAAAIEAGAFVVSNAIELVAATAIESADSLSFIGRNFSRARAHGLPRARK